jgi:hypothetical protein
MASYIKKYEIVTLAVHATFTAHTSGISGLILGGVLCGGVRFDIDMKKETEEEEGGSLKV